MLLVNQERSYGEPRVLNQNGMMWQNCDLGVPEIYEGI